MKTFFILFGITFIMILVSAGLINIAKTRKRKNSSAVGCHGGGTSCASCSSPAQEELGNVKSKKCSSSATK